MLPPGDRPNGSGLALRGEPRTPAVTGWPRAVLLMCAVTVIVGIAVGRTMTVLRYVAALLPGELVIDRLLARCK